MGDPTGRELGLARNRKTANDEHEVPSPS